jgi:hypothetical protein
MKTLAHKTGVLLEEPEYFGSRSFCKEAISRFPRLASQLAEDKEHIHLQMGAFATAARSAIEARDFAFLTGLFGFLDEIMSRPNVHCEIENAIAISFLAPVEFKESEAGRHAWDLLPEKLKRLLQKAA